MEKKKTDGSKDRQDQKHAWLATSTLATAASVVATGGAAAATVQINLSGNEVDEGGNSLNADFTGDGTDDLPFGFIVNSGPAPIGFFGVNAFIAPNPLTFGIGIPLGTVGGGGGSFSVRAGYQFSPTLFDFGSVMGSSSLPLSATGYTPITFTDAAINMGATTNGFLEVVSTVDSSSEYSIALTRLIFDDMSTAAPSVINITDTPGTVFDTFKAVPEPGRLGLLALGAAGVLARRSRSKG